MYRQNGVNVSPLLHGDTKSVSPFLKVYRRFQQKYNKISMLHFQRYTPFVSLKISTQNGDTFPGLGL